MVPAERTKFVMFISSDTLLSNRAVANIRRVADEYLRGDYDLELVDVLDDPETTDEYRILSTPTLIRERPLPRRLLTGDLSDRDRLVAALDFDH